MPGHTRGSAAYLALGAIFLGDSAGASDDGVLEGAPWIFSVDTDQNHASLRALAERLAPRADEVRWLLFGHQGALDGFAPLAAFE